eukprot:2170204-Amphidinium_carterae.1
MADAVMLIDEACEGAEVKPQPQATENYWAGFGVQLWSTTEQCGPSRPLSPVVPGEERSAPPSRSAPRERSAPQLARRS